MVKLLNFFKQKSWIIAALIFILAFVLRLIASLKIAWRPDEIVYVDWIGNWFSTHFWSYFFQFYHHIYPPQSNIFGNPPLSMWMLTLGIVVAKKFGFSLLLGARVVNVLIGSISALLIFNFGRKWFNLWVGLIAGIAFSLIPIIVANNGTAYLETLSVLMIVLALEFSFRFISSAKRINLFLLGIVLGLSVLIKYIDFPLILGFLVAIPLFSDKDKNFWKNYLIFIGIIILTVTVLWSGMRDPNHLKELYWLYTNKLYSPFPTEYPFPVFKYYYLMLIGILPPVIIIGALVEILLLVRNMIQKSWRDFKFDIIITGLVIIYIAYNSAFATYGAPHQLLPLMPLGIILAALGLNKLYLLVADLWLKVVFSVLVLLCLALPLTAFRPEFWSLYASSLVGGTNNSFSLYNVGVGGEGVPESAAYLNQNAAKDSRISVIAYDWIIKKYLQNRSATSLFQKEGIFGATARGADYAVVARPFMEGKQTETWLEFSQMDPIYSVKEKGIVLANIYKIDYSRVQQNNKIATNSNEWDVKKVNNTPKIDYKNDEIKVDYEFKLEFGDQETEDSRVLLMNKNKIIPIKSNGFTAEIYGDGNDKLLTIFLLADNKDYLTYDLISDWQGFKKIYIPFSMFNYNSSDPTRNEPNFNEKYSVDIQFLSKKAIKGQFGFRNVSYASYPEE